MMMSDEELITETKQLLPIWGNMIDTYEDLDRQAINIGESTVMEHEYMYECLLEDALEEGEEEDNDYFNDEIEKRFSRTYKDKSYKMNNREQCVLGELHGFSDKWYTNDRKVVNAYGEGYIVPVRITSLNNDKCLVCQRIDMSIFRLTFRQFLTAVVTHIRNDHMDLVKKNKQKVK